MICQTSFPALLPSQVPFSLSFIKLFCWWMLCVLTFIHHEMVFRLLSNSLRLLTLSHPSSAVQIHRKSTFFFNFVSWPLSTSLDSSKPCNVISLLSTILETASPVSFTCNAHQSRWHATWNIPCWWLLSFFFFFQLPWKLSPGLKPWTTEVSVLKGHAVSYSPIIAYNS